MKLQGCMTALITPFSNGQIDFDALDRLIEEQISGGIQALVPCGTTGESPTLSHEEQDQVIDFTTTKAAGRVPVVAGTGSNSTEEALRLTRHAKQAGADACLVVNPYYNKPTQEGMFQHIQRLAEAQLPIVLYNIPGRTGIELTAETIVRMYEEIDMVIALKEATGKIDTASLVARDCEISILSGDDALTLPMGAVGGCGVVSVLGNLLPGEIRKLTDAMLGGDLKTATAQHQKLFDLCKVMFCETNPIPIKAAMAMLGKCKNELRLPMTPLSEKYVQPLKQALQDFGLNVS
ncbi:MAG: 4-hydroxy-tetrahydrodipicolinate synthase [Phycisphaerae bacterium]